MRSAKLMQERQRTAQTCYSTPKHRDAEQGVFQAMARGFGSLGEFPASQCIALRFWHNLCDVFYVKAVMVLMLGLAASGFGAHLEEFGANLQGFWAKLQGCGASEYGPWSSPPLGPVPGSLSLVPGPLSLGPCPWALVPGPGP